MDDFNAGSVDSKSMLDKGLALLAEARDLQERLASNKAQWEAHIELLFPPVAGINVTAAPTSDPHVAAYYEAAPEKPAARFATVAAARKSQEREKWQHLQDKISAPEAADEPAWSAEPPITQAVPSTPKESIMESENQATQETQLQFPPSPFPPYDPVEHARVQSDALSAIIATTESMTAAVRGTVELDVAKQAVAADLAALDLIDDLEIKHTALLLMNESMVGQVQYQVGLRNQDAQIWVESHAAAAQQQVTQAAAPPAPEAPVAEKPVQAAEPAALEQPPAGQDAASAAYDEKIARQVIMFRGVVGDAQYAMSGPIDGITPDEAKPMVADHLHSLSQITENDLRKFTVMAMWEAARAQQHYSAELAAQSPELYAANASLGREEAPAAAPTVEAKPNMTIDAAALAQLSDARAKDRQAVEKSLGWNTIERGDSAERTPAVALEKPAVAAQAVQPAAVAPPADRSLTAVPPEVERAYLHVNDKFYMANNKKHVAFEDRGAKLQTALDDDKVVLSMVQIAHARGWTEIKVSGNGDFPKKAWREAALLGIAVKGYTPTELDKADLARRMPAKPENVIASTPASQAGIYINAEDAALLAATKAMQKAAAQAPAAPAAPAVAATAAPAPAKPAGDTLVAHGPAKYLHDKTNSDSYYVTLENEKGKQRTIWGVGLQEAIAKAGVKNGDQVDLSKNGVKQVEVDANIKDVTGSKVVGTEKIGATRNEWAIKAVAFATQAPADAVKAHPDLAGALGKAAAIDKQAAVDGHSPEVRALVAQRVNQNIVNSIERGEAHPVKVREAAEVQVQPQNQPQAQQAQM